MTAKWLRLLSIATVACSLLSSSLFIIRQVHSANSQTSGEEWQPDVGKSYNTTRDEKEAFGNESTSPAVSLYNRISAQTVSIASEPSINETAAKATILANDTHPLNRIKVPFPILVASLPKSGTTSTARYFNCGKIWTAHTFANTVGTTHAPRKQMRIGHCMLNNIKAGRPPLLDCGSYQVWSDLGHPRGTPCFYPSVHGLAEFYAAYPTATILLVTRNSTAWASSVLRWKQGHLVEKMAAVRALSATETCDCAGLGEVL